MDFTRRNLDLLPLNFFLERMEDGKSISNSLSKKNPTSFFTYMPDSVSSERSGPYDAGGRWRDPDSERGFKYFCCEDFILEKCKKTLLMDGSLFFVMELYLEEYPFESDNDILNEVTGLRIFNDQVFLLVNEKLGNVNKIHEYNSFMLAWLDNYFLFESERKFDQFFLSKESINHISDNIILSMTNAYDGESLIIAEYGETPEIFKT